MRELSLQDLYHQLSSTHQLLQEIGGRLGWDYYDMWPVWAYYFKETDPSVVVETDDVTLTVKFPDRYWVLPLTANMKKLTESCLALAGRGALAMPLHMASWMGIPVREVCQDFQVLTDDLNTMKKESLKSRNQGIRRYLKPKFRTGAISRQEGTAAVDLVRRWDEQKKARGGTDNPNSELYIKMLTDPKYVDIWPDQRCMTVWDDNKLIGFGLGTPLSKRRWSMIIRLADTDYPYLSDYMYNATSLMFQQFPIESDGHAYTSMDPAAEENASLRWYKERYCDPALTMYTALTNPLPVKVSHENPHDNVR